jgi:predicted MFS family arabinose efflux permease
MLGHVAGMVDLVALPLWVGTLVQHHGMDFEHAGLTVTLFLLGAVFASAVLAPRFDRLPHRACAIAGFSLAAISLFSVSRTMAAPILFALHAAAGIGAGTALSMVHGTMGRSVNPHRLFALAGTTLGVLGCAFYAIVPQIMAAAGRASLFVVMAGLMVLAAVAALAFPVAGRAAPLTRRVQGRVPLPSGVVPLVVGVVCLTLNQTVVFSFVERIGATRGFSTGQVNAVLAAVGIINLFPAALAAMFQHRLKPIPVAITALSLQVALALTLTCSGTFAPYAGAASLYASVLIFAHTFLFGLIARIDPSGRATALTPAMIMVGSAIGPALAGAISQRLGFAALGGTTVVIAALGIACFMRARRQVAHAGAAEAPRPARAPASSN